MKAQYIFADFNPYNTPACYGGFVGSKSAAFEKAGE